MNTNPAKISSSTEEAFNKVWSEVISKLSENSVEVATPEAKAFCMTFFIAGSMHGIDIARIVCKEVYGPKENKS